MRLLPAALGRALGRMEEAEPTEAKPGEEAEASPEQEPPVASPPAPHEPIRARSERKLVEVAQQLIPRGLALALVKHDRERHQAAGASGHVARVLADRNWDAMKRDLSSAIPMTRTVLNPPTDARLQKEQLRSLIIPSLTLTTIPAIYSPSHVGPIAVGACAINAAVQLASAVCDGMQVLAWLSLSKSEPDTLWK